MAALVEKAQVSGNHRVELYVGGVIWIIEDDVQAGKVKQEIKLQASESTILFDFLLLYQERLSRERDGQVP